MIINIGLVDDHKLMLQALGFLVDSLPSFKVLLYAVNGEDLLQKMQSIETEPDILVLDVNMPVMDGPKTAEIIAAKYPLIKLVALSKEENESAIIKMVRAGCCCYLTKDTEPAEFERALNEVYARGYYNADKINRNYRHLLIKATEEAEIIFKEQEKIFLKLACSDLTYKQIASKMHLAERTIDGYREALFEKLSVQSRVGMVLEALKRELVSLA